MSSVHLRLPNQLFENPHFQVDTDSIGYIARDMINMNWWNTSGILAGYMKNKRVNHPFTNEQKLVAVQLKEFYRKRILEIRNENKFRDELRGYINGSIKKLEQLNAYSMPSRANPSQYFVSEITGEMTWVDCTSRATYAAKYVFQNGYIDFDGVCRVLGVHRILEFIRDGKCTDLGISHLFEEGHNSVKTEIFSQKKTQRTVSDWVDVLGITILPERQWLFDAIRDVRTDPFKTYEASRVAIGTAPGVNERLYGFTTSQTYAASDASRASHASNASRASDASDASRASDASSASRASDASSASDAGCTGFTGTRWADSPHAVTKPWGLRYPNEFRSNIFAIAGNWKINTDIVSRANLGWFDPFSGHGSSPLYAKRVGVNYLGFETNERAFKEYLSIVSQECQLAPGSQVELRLADSTVFDPSLVGKFDLCYTSPPYFNFEEYGGNRGHYQGLKTYGEFHERVTVPVFKNVFRYLVPGSTLALQTEKDKKRQTEWHDVILSLGYVLEKHTLTGGEKIKYSAQAKRDQSLLVFKRPFHAFPEHKKEIHRHE